MRLTLPEINLLGSVLGEQRQGANEDQIYFTHLQGHLNAFAFHEPNKYPRLESLLPRKVSEPPRDLQLENAMRIARELGHI